MDRQVYARMAELEDRHWWFTARRRILTELPGHSIDRKAPAIIICQTVCVGLA